MGMALGDCLVAESWRGSSLPMNAMAKTTRNTLNHLKYWHTHALRRK